jgi:cytochrome b pre-mRNA-processing protein 3
MLGRLFRPPPRREAAYRLYANAVEAARRPVYYAELGVPDTLDGRFELIALHVALVLRRLAVEPTAKPFAQEVFDAMFADLDRALREMGSGDLGVGAHVKRMASAFYGRARAYERGLAGAEDLGAALRRNLYGTAAPSAAALATMAAWAEAAAAGLDEQEVAALMRGEVAFPTPAPVPATSS